MSESLTDEFDFHEKIAQAEQSLSTFQVFERLEENETILQAMRHQLEEYNYNHEERLDALEEEVAELKARESELAQKWYESDKERERWKREGIRLEADMERYQATLDQTKQDIESLEGQLELVQQNMTRPGADRLSALNLLKFYEQMGIRVLTQEGKPTRLIVGKNECCVRILDTQHHPIDTDTVWRILYRAMDRANTQFKVI
ncbi:hypothetical protein BY458DRAFT_504579 [Sporodiniella umbellata]|nr:hypothetical protein BY458DRAFT_504579 [Sporodiniella umbellata]